MNRPIHTASASTPALALAASLLSLAPPAAAQGEADERAVFTSPEPVPGSCAAAGGAAGGTAEGRS